MLNVLPLSIHRPAALQKDWKLRARVVDGTGTACYHVKPGRVMQHATVISINAGIVLTPLT